MHRTAIIIEKTLTPGEAAIVAAIVMGQAVFQNNKIYEKSGVVDKDGNRHAGIRYSTVVLKGGSHIQLANYVKQLNIDYGSSISTVLFSRFGQKLQNNFLKYKEVVTNSQLEALEAVGVLVTGGDEAVRKATKKFSIYS